MFWTIVGALLFVMFGLPLLVFASMVVIGGIVGFLQGGSDERRVSEMV